MKRVFFFGVCVCVVLYTDATEGISTFQTSLLYHIVEKISVYNNVLDSWQR